MGDKKDGKLGIYDRWNGVILLHTPTFFLCVFVGAGKDNV